MDNYHREYERIKKQILDMLKPGQELNSFQFFVEVNSKGIICNKYYKAIVSGMNQKEAKDLEKKFNGIVEIEIKN